MKSTLLTVILYGLTLQPRPDGSVLTVPLKHPKLAMDAIPTLFPDSPSYLSSEPPAKRKNPDDRRSKEVLRDNLKFQKWLEKDRIPSFTDLLAKVDEYLKDFTDFQVMKADSFICIFLVDFSRCPRITVSIKVLSNLSVQVFVRDTPVSAHSLTFILGDTNCIRCWSQVTELVSYV